MSNTLNGQVLILPINNCIFSAGYKNKAYLKQQGYEHYGVDLFNGEDKDLTVYSCGEGEVVKCGWDGITGNDRCGYVIVIIYKDVYLPNDIVNSNGVILYKKGTVIDLTCRMYHFSKILCKKGQKVDRNTIIGYYGNTGSTLVNGKPMGNHLHIEFDTDTNWPTLVYGMTVGGNILNRTEDVKAAGGLGDSTLNPSLLWTLDYNQNISGKYTGWYDNSDINLLKYNDVVGSILKEEDNPPFDGIDVSEHNGVIDWSRVKQNGIDFAMIRLGWTWYDGGVTVDDYFKTNITAAIQAGLDVGVYVYAYDKTPQAAKISAEKVLELIKDYKISYPVVYDMEETKLSGYTTNTKSYNNSIASSFLDTIESSKYYAMLYTYTSFALSYLDMRNLSKYDLWIADYRGKDKLDSQFKYPYGIYQYTGTGSCDGVNGYCDRNYSYKNYAKIIQNNKLNNIDNIIVDQPTESIPPIDISEAGINDLKEQIKLISIELSDLRNNINNLILFKSEVKNKDNDIKDKISELVKIL